MDNPGVHRPRNLDWKRAAALLYGDWGTSKAYVIGFAFSSAFAVASDDSGQIRSVRFLIGSRLVAELTRPPYEATIVTQQLPPGEHVLRAHATDAAGNSASSETVLVVGAGATSRCPHPYVD